MNSRPVVLITGASRGLGRSMAQAFALKGYDVGINYSEDNDGADVTSSLVQKAGGQALKLVADVSQSSEVDKMFKALMDHWGRVDVLVNNAGVVRNQLISKMTNDDWKKVMAVNLDGPFFTTRAAIPIMRKQKSGSIVNITSYIAPKGVRGAANYAVSKAGVITFTKNTALEEGSNGIRANAVMPGFHVTDMNKDVWDKFSKEIQKQHLLSELPKKEDLASFIVTIAELKTVTGQVFPFESRPL